MGRRWDPDGKRNRVVVKPATLQGMLGRENLQGESQWDPPFFQQQKFLVRIERIASVRNCLNGSNASGGAFRMIAGGLYVII